MTVMKTTSPSFGSVSIFRITRNESSSPGGVAYSQHSPSFSAMSVATADDPKPMRDSSVFNGFFMGLTVRLSYRRPGGRWSANNIIQIFLGRRAENAGGG